MTDDEKKVRAIIRRATYGQLEKYKELVDLEMTLFEKKAWD